MSRPELEDDLRPGEVIDLTDESKRNYRKQPGAGSDNRGPARRNDGHQKYTPRNNGSDNGGDGKGDTMDITALEDKTLTELRTIAKDANVGAITTLKKQDLILRILQAKAESSGNQFATGTLEILPEGYGFLRRNGFTPSPEDIYVSLSQIKRFGLRTGDVIQGQIRPPKDNEKYFGLLRIEAINQSDP
ncbi:MAG: Rho termination factor N-terminal domain-containing protein, partial [bacterium]